MNFAELYINHSKKTIYKLLDSDLGPKILDLSNAVQRSDP